MNPRKHFDPMLLRQRLLTLARQHFGLAGDSLHELDRRTLADIGIDASEIASIEAEAQGRAALTRLRIVAERHHG